MNPTTQGSAARHAGGISMAAALAALLVLASPARGQFTPPDTMTKVYTHSGGSLTVDYTKLSVRGPHFTVWLQNADNTFTQQTRAEPVSTYLGRIAERPGAIAACITFADGSMKSSITLEDGSRWTGTGTSLTLPSTSWTPKYPTEVVGSGGAGSSVYAADIGVDLMPSYFDQQSDSVTKTMDMVEFTFIEMNSLMLRDTAMQLRLGRVIIRGGTDPYDNPLADLKSAWQGSLNSQLPATSYDFVVGVRPNLGGGVAYVPGQFAFCRSLNHAGNGNFTNPWRHELGHNLSSGHYPGDTPEGPTPMSGNQLMRFSSPEVAKIVSRRNSISGNLNNLGAASVPVPPRANGDRGTVSVNRTPVTLDVLANDSDTNGQSLVIQSFDATSNKGGTVTRSIGTGPGGRDRLIYTPLASMTASTDWFKYRIQDSSGQQAVGWVAFKVTNSTVPEPWTSQDIGNVGPAGSASESNGTFTVRGAGADWDTKDSFHFVHQPLHGNGEITARIASVQNVSSWSKAGVMIRDTLDDNSAYAIAAVSAGQGIQFQSRLVAGAPLSGGVTITGAPPQWVRLRRMGDLITAYVSADGAAWTQLASRTMPMGEDIYMGMAVTARTTSATSAGVFGDISAASFGEGSFAITSSPQSWEGYAESDVTLSAMVVSAGTVNCQWQKDGVDLPGETNLTLALNDVEVGDAGDYQLVVSDGDVTSTSDAASLIVHAVGTGYPRAVRILDPLAYWRLDETSGTIAVSDRENADGTLAGSVTVNQAGPQPPTYDEFEATNVAYKFNGNGSRVSTVNFDLNTSALTIAGWVKRNGNAPGNAGIGFCRGGNTVAGLNFGSSNELRYHWNNASNTYSWNSGLVPPNGVWTFVALVVEPSKATIYMNAGSGLVSATNAVTHGTEEFDAPFCIGQDTNSSTRSFNGWIDEMAIYSRALTAAEIASLANAQAQGGAAMSFEGWRNSHFGSQAGDPAIAGELADPDGDGMSNLIEYALNADPELCDPALKPAISKEVDGIALVYRRHPSASDVSYIVQESGDLDTWTPATVVEEVLSDDGTTQLIKAKVGTGGATGKFLRLQVERR